MDNTGMTEIFRLLDSYQPKRDRSLQQTVRSFCERTVELNMVLGSPQDWRDAFRDLCEAIGFDAEAYAANGYDPTDV